MQQHAGGSSGLLFRRGDRLASWEGDALQTWHRRRGGETRWANHAGREPGLPIKTART